MHRLSIHITGIVQGVGFRPFVYNLAIRLGLAGWVRNTSAGVDIELEGETSALEEFVRRLRADAPPLAYLDQVNVTPREGPVGYKTFDIRHSESVLGAFQPISPDVSICPDCLRELFDPNDRRHRYPFINCTNCGPRKFVGQGAMRDHSVASVQLTVMKARGQAMSNGSSLPLSNLQHFPDPRQPLGKVRIILNLRLNASNDASCRAVRFYLELPCYFLKVFPSERSCQIHRDISRLIRDSPPDCKQIRVFDSIICRNGCLDGFNGDRREHFRFRHFRAHFCSEEALIYCLDEFRTSKDGRKFFQ